MYVYNKTSTSYLPVINAVLRIIVIALWMTDLNKVNKRKERNTTIAGWQSKYKFFHKGGKGQAILSLKKKKFFFPLEEKPSVFQNVKFTE